MNLLRDTLVAALQTTLTGIANVAAIGGRLDAGEIRRMTVAPPAVLVALLDTGPLSIAGRNQWALSASWAAYVVVRGDKERDERALELVTKVLRGIAAENWGSPLFKGVTPGSVRAVNLYSGPIDATATALWAVLWRQDCKLPIED